MANRVVEILVSIKDDAVGFFGRLGEAISSVTANIFSLSTAIEAFVTGAVIKGIEHLVEIFAQTDMTITRVNAALQISGRYTREGSEEIQKMAASMQNLTTVSREAALEVSATVGALARELSASDLAEVQKAAIGLSETFGISLERASSLIGRTLEGSFNALHRYGIEVDLSASQQDRFTQVMSKMAPLFEISKEAANTFAGAMEQAKNQFVEIERTLGEIIANAFGLGSPKSIRDAFKNLNTEIREHADVWVHYARIVVDALELVGVAVLQLIVKLADFIQDKVLPLLNQVQGTLDGVLYGLKIGFQALPGMSFPAPSGQEPGAAKRTGMAGYLDDLLLMVGDVKTQWEKLRAEIEGRAPKVHLAPIGAQEHAGLQNVGHQEEDPNAELLHETAVAKDLTERLKLLQQAYVEGRGNTAEYAAEHEHVANALERSAARLRALIDGDAANFITKEKARAQLVLVQADLRKFATEGLEYAKTKTHELAAAEANLDEEYKAGIITQDELLARRADIRKALEDEILIIKAMILAHQFNNAEMAEALDLLKKLTDALIKAGGAAKTFKDRMKEALGAGTTEPIKEVAQSIADSAKTWEDAWTKSAGAAMAAGQTSLKGIGKAIQQAAKVEEAMALADALKYLAHAAFDTFFNPGAAVKDLEAAGLATASAAAYALIAGGGGAPSGGAGGSGGGSAGANATSRAVSNLANGVTIIVPPGLTNSQQWVEELMGHIEAAGENRITVRSSA